MEIISLIKKSPLFRDLPDPDISEIASIATIRKYEKGNIIFSEGEEAEGFFLLVSGEVKIFKLSAEGKEQLLHIIVPGDIFAEAAVFSGISYPAFAQAVSRVQVILFPKDAFYKITRKNPNLCLNLMAAMARLLRQFANLIEELSLRDVSSRLAKYLIDTALHQEKEGINRQEIILGVSKSHLASRLGTISETLSRTLKNFKLKGILEVEGKRIFIKDWKSLERISAGMK